MNKIQHALAKLDINNDNHWTDIGEPRLDTVRILAADQSITREQIVAECGGFTRHGARGIQAPADTADQSATLPTGSTTTENPGTVTGSEDEFDTLGLEEEKAKLEAMLAGAAKLQKLIGEQRALVDSLIIHNEPKKENLANHVSHYHAAQKQILEDRKLRKELIRESGIPLAQLARDLKSPLDSDLARRKRQTI